MTLHFETIETDTCLACGSIMSARLYETCPGCKSEHLLPTDTVEKARLKDTENDYHFPGIEASKFTQELKTRIVAQDNEEKIAESKQKHQDARDRKNAEHPRLENGELDMTDPKNNPLIPGSTASVDVLDDVEDIDYTDPENNPLIPTGE